MIGVQRFRVQRFRVQRFRVQRFKVQRFRVQRFRVQRFKVQRFGSEVQGSDVGSEFKVPAFDAAVVKDRLAERRGIREQSMFQNLEPFEP
jgi:hypothetical protein